MQYDNCVYRIKNSSELDEMTVYKLLALHYCQQALQLCLEARILRYEKHYREAAKICSLISTLCIENEHESCKREGKLCASSAKQLTDGNYSKAEKLCNEARRICPKNHALTGG